MLRKLLAELLGTFALVFAGTGAIVVNALTSGAVTHQGIALTFGLIVMAMIYALGDVSGAHFNPAVTTGFFLASRLPLRTALLYIAAQLAGALLASTTLLLLFGNIASLGATIPLYSPAQSFALETILTAILMFVILSVSSGSRESGTTAALAIGGIIALEALFAGPISGASMNPPPAPAPPPQFRHPPPPSFPATSAPSGSTSSPPPSAPPSPSPSGAPRAIQIPPQSTNPTPLRQAPGSQAIARIT
jgi:aquaporin Z